MSAIKVNVDSARKQATIATSEGIKTLPWHCIKLSQLFNMGGASKRQGSKNE